ncbi:uncharacterized protein MAM_00568 [Metarhizium album ARSEF 1941]|uniref:Uncharacterized protein n=1 Tax=Metarhizium album (strain ARSEF 1941) TaxID=1081103 RepID=A0A0B2WZ39_METAS|nr:uncharacterized protein MAM_00568 [Metarhizium album ARSEF 1941]KHO01567.1 hypothetical protein MAM_00568 [Metarhizium album ARSEF 1941]
MFNLVPRRILLGVAVVFILCSYFLLKERLGALSTTGPGESFRDAVEPDGEMLSDRNLAKNGGLLDEVIWLQRTQDQADPAFLDKLIDSEQTTRGLTWNAATATTRAHTTGLRMMFYVARAWYSSSIKVYTEDTTILSMVHLRATRPDYLVVGVKTINQPRSSWLHWGLGVVRPYMPETGAFYPKDDEMQGHDQPVN